MNTFDDMEVWAVHDGTEAPYDGDVLNVTPVMRVRGRYRDFAILETPTLGALTRGSRVATNVYEVLKAARGKQVLFFPARFDAHEVQAADGYAYQIAVQLFNQNFGKSVSAYVSTDAQGDWWGGAGGGTVAHSAIACFLGDTAEATMAFAATRPADIPRIALVDFRNDCVGTSRAGDPHHVPPLPRAHEGRAAGRGAQVQALRRAAGHRGQHARRLGAAARRQARSTAGSTRAWCSRCARPSTASGRPGTWPGRTATLAESYCRDVKIAVTGGFTPAKIRQFEDLKVPADIYGVGSWLLSTCDVCGTNNDFTADVVRVKIEGRWYDLAKVGRKACDNLMLERVQ